MTARDPPDESLVHVPRWTCALGVVTGVAAIASPPAVPVSKGCGLRGYAYTGLQSDRQGFGVTATLTALADPLVERGHVAAWVGVGAPGEGPHGTNEWLQIGLNRIAGRDARLYYEIVQPWGTRYVELDRNISAGRHIQVPDAGVEIFGAGQVGHLQRHAAQAGYPGGSHGVLSPVLAKARARKRRALPWVNCACTASKAKAARMAATGAGS